MGTKWKADIDEKNKKISCLKTEIETLEKKGLAIRENSRKYEERYSLAKVKIEEMGEKLNEVANAANATSLKQEAEINNCKARIDRLDALNHELEMRSTSDKLR